MFDKKIPVTKREKKQPVNRFIKAAKQKAAITTSENGALKYSTTGNSFVDDFGKLGTYIQPRDFAAVSVTMSTLWSQDPLLTLKYTLYLRMITRKTKLSDGTYTETVQRGAGLKTEGFLRMMWIAVYHPDTFWKNIDLFIAGGSWKDIFNMLKWDAMYHGWEGKVLDWKRFAMIILAGIRNPKTSELVKKYLPRIQADSKCTTPESQAMSTVGKYLSSVFFGKKDYQRYRKLKSSGTAHKWQQLISKQLFAEIDFSTVHGRALAKMVGSKFLQNHKLEQKYLEWIQSQPVAKYTGYPHELFAGKLNTLVQEYTVNKQFLQLVETAKQNVKGTSMIVVRDISGSMDSLVPGTTMSAGNIAKALALFFSYMLEGTFSGSWIEFNSSAKLKQWNGSTPVEKYRNDHSSYIGNTNFMSVIQLLCSIRRSRDIAESEFPSGIICLSDGEFDPSSLSDTNVADARRQLLLAGFSQEYVLNFKIVLWNIKSRYYGRINVNFETGSTAKNTFYFSGYDASVMAFLTGFKNGSEKEPTTPEELFHAAMSQELLGHMCV